jgi:hypothetical protein
MPSTRESDKKIKKCVVTGVQFATIFALAYQRQASRPLPLRKKVEMRHSILRIVSAFVFLAIVSAPVYSQTRKPVPPPPPPPKPRPAAPVQNPNDLDRLLPPGDYTISMLAFCTRNYAVCSISQRS